MNLKLLKRINYIFFSILFLIFITSCQAKLSKEPPIAVKGNLDLSSWDISTDGPIDLDGEWEFYWKKFLLHEDFLNPETTNSKKYFTVPDAWNDYQINKNNKLSSFGYATFRLNLKNIKHEGIISFKFLDIGLAYTLYANGKKVTSVGKIGKTHDEMIPEYRAHIAELDTMNNNIELILNVSNFHHRKGGIWDSISIGTSDAIHSAQDKNIALELFLFGSFIIISLYHIGFFILRNALVLISDIFRELFLLIIYQQVQLL